MYLWEEINSKLQMLIHSIHQGLLLSISFLSGWISMSPLWVLAAVGVFVSHLSVTHPMLLELTLFHSVKWSLDLSLSVKMAYIHISILDSKFIPDLYHISLSIPLSRYAIFTFASLMF